MSQVCLGFDPGRDKCGVAIMTGDRQLLYHAILLSATIDQELPRLCDQYGVTEVILGNQTTAQTWQARLQSLLPPTLTPRLVDERFSTAEARQRYWDFYPPQGLGRFIPQGLRTPPRPVDDIVAIVLIERHLSAL